MKIPKSFKLFGTTIKVVWDNDKMNDQSNYGTFEYCNNQITLSTTQGNKTLADDRILDTFYYEKVHAILDHMHKRDLSEDEEFVDVFAKLLRQSDETSEV